MAAITLASTDIASAAERKGEDTPPTPITEIGPARIAVVSLARQRVSFYDADGGVVRAPISSGQASLDTPVGVYSILQKKVDHTSNIYDDAKMPFMQRITWSGIALHAGALPGYPASHGCVRLPLSFAEQIFDKTRLGLRVVISSDDVAPVAITHPALFQPRAADDDSASRMELTAYSESDPPLLPDVTAWPGRRHEQERLRAVFAEEAAVAKAASDAAEPLKAPHKQLTAENAKFQKSFKAASSAKTSAEKQLANAEKALANAKKPKAIANAERSKAGAQAAIEKAVAKIAALTPEADRIGTALAAAQSALDAADSAMKAAVAKAKEAERKLLPVSVFISLRTQRIYIRQGHEPVMDMPVTIRDADILPIGTHVFTALDYTPDGNSTRWNVVSLARFEDSYEQPRAYRDYDYERDRYADRDEPVRVTKPRDSLSAVAALERVEIPQELRDQISEYVWPGTSLIISDEEMHKKETNNFTDFVVLLDGYPQGGIKKRRPPPVQPYYFDNPYGFLFSSQQYDSPRPRTRTRYRSSPSPWPFW
ncbi:MAG: L,D-transpeptidase family protein [Hyphomicrobium sp.]